MRAAALAATLRRHWAVGPLLVAAGVIYARTQSAYGMLMWDEAQYSSLARSLVRGDGYTIAGAPEHLRPPLLPLAGAASLWLTGRADDGAVHGATVACALLALVVVYAAAARVYDRLTGLAALVLLGSAPWFWESTANFLSEIPLLALFATAVFCWSCGLYRDARWFHASWACAGLALLTRYTTLLFAPLAALLTLVALATGDTEVRRRLVSGHSLLAPLLALVLVAPWLAHQALTNGDPLVGFREASSQLQVYMPGISMPWWRYLTGLPAMLSWPTTGLLLVGALWALRRGDRFAIQCLVTIVFVLFWFSWYRYKEPRLVSAMLPAAALVAAVGLTRGVISRPPREAVAGLALAVVLFNWGATQAHFDSVRTLGYPSFLEAMTFLREQTPSDARIVGPNPPQIVWYADRSVVDFPPRSELAERLAHADWVVVTNFERGQPPYVGEVAARLPDAAFQAGDAVRFADARYWTLVVRADVLRALLPDDAS